MGQCLGFHLGEGRFWTRTQLVGGVTTVHATADVATGHRAFEAFAVFLETPGASALTADLMSCNRYDVALVRHRWFVFRVESSGVAL